MTLIYYVILHVMGNDDVDDVFMCLVCPFRCRQVLCSQRINIT